MKDNKEFYASAEYLRNKINMDAHSERAKKYRALTARLEGHGFTVAYFSVTVNGTLNGNPVSNAKGLIKDGRLNIEEN